ncbi:MAG: hypothetical protein LBU92_04780 [Prevotellaceae bacterium]|jgi:hypothetical protein|nr:hypothetical protein [Prevotellaceae bacterium]
MCSSVKRVVLLWWVTLAAGAVFAQDNNSLNTYTPYSMYGFGDLSRPGLTATGAMAGITTGVRDARQVDFVNPAGATARDSVLNFVLDFGGELKNFYSKSAATSTSYNTGNFHHLVAAFRAGRFGVNFGVTPYSRVGYEVEKQELDSEILATTGSVRYLYRGEDGLNQLFFNLGFDITRKLAVGVGAKYFFGNLSRYYNVEYASVDFYNTKSSSVLKLSNVVPVFGAQYTLGLGKTKHAVLGTSFQPGIDMRATEVVSSVVYGMKYDTAFYRSASAANVLMPMQINVGASLVSGDRWLLGADFCYQDFSKVAVMGHSDMGASYSVKLGGYYTPNLYDVRYFHKRLTYRGGLRYERTPYQFQGHAVNDMAVTAGISMPMRGAGYLSIGAEVGQRGAISNGMVRETYVNLSLGVTLFESWFKKYQYE